MRSSSTQPPVFSLPFTASDTLRHYELPRCNGRFNPTQDPAQTYWGVEAPEETAVNDPAKAYQYLEWALEHIQKMDKTEWDIRASTPFDHKQFLEHVAGNNIPHKLWDGLVKQLKGQSLESAKIDNKQLTAIKALIGRLLISQSFVFDAILWNTLNISKLGIKGPLANEPENPALAQTDERIDAMDPRNQTDGPINNQQLLFCAYISHTYDLYFTPQVQKLMSQLIAEKLSPLFQCSKIQLDAITRLVFELYQSVFNEVIVPHYKQKVWKIPATRENKFNTFKRILKQHTGFSAVDKQTGHIHIDALLLLTMSHSDNYDLLFSHSDRAFSTAIRANLTEFNIDIPPELMTLFDRLLQPTQKLMVVKIVSTTKCYFCLISFTKILTPAFPFTF